MRSRSAVLLWFVLVLLPMSAAGQDKPVFEVSLEPKRLGVEDLTRLVVTVFEPGKVKTAPRLGEFSNFEVVAGPSTENQFSIVNGVSSSSIRFVYILQPNEVGRAVVGSIVIEVGGEELTSEPVEAEIVEGSLQAQAPGGRPRARAFDPFGSIFPDSRSRRNPRQTKVILRHLIPKAELVLGETMLVQVVLDATTASVERFDFPEPPSYPGWWAQSVKLPEPITPKLVEVDGTRYYRYTVSQHVLVPLKTGALAVPEVRGRIGLRSGSVFEPLHVVERRIGEREVQIGELPVSPEGFAGAVGQLQYSVSLDPTAIELGQSAVMTLTLEGEGNLPLVEAPSLWPSCEGCDAYPPEEESTIKVDIKGIHGSRTWKTTIVPRTGGDLRLEPVILAVYNPTLGSYRRQTLGPLELSVAAPLPDPTPEVATDAIDSVEAELTGSEGSETVAQSGGFAWYWIIGALFFGACLGGVVVWFLARTESFTGPPRRSGQSPSERARDLQAALEQWWMGVRGSDAAQVLEQDMEELRRELETVRFAPGRADHTNTVVDLEERMRRLTKRA